MSKAVMARYLNRVLVVTGLVDTGTTDGGGNPIYTTTTKGTVKGRIDKKDQPDEVNGPDLNPVISEYEGFTELPVGFIITERDTFTAADGVYEILQSAPFYERVDAHHLQLDLRKITA